MAEELNFNIPTNDRETARAKSKVLPVLMSMVFIAVLINIGVVLMKHNIKKERPGGAVLSAEQQKKLALKLEIQGLGSAAAAWKEYMSLSTLGDEDAARIWYRIGKLYQNNNEYEKALDSYYRSESFSQPEDITPEVARRIQECLEAMGKFAALRYELADRVGLNPGTTDTQLGDGKDPVVAEIGTQKIMKSDLDQKIEHRIDQQISQLVSYLPQDQLNKKKEALLKQYSTDNQRQLFLNQYLIEEVLYRQAREANLMEKADVKAMLKDMERSLLASKLLQQEMSKAINITPGDLKMFYEANKQNYVRPQRIKLAHILVQSKQKAQDIRNKIKEGKDFAALANAFSQDLSTKDNGGELANWIEKKETITVPGIGDLTEAIDAIFTKKEGDVVDRDIESEKGIHILKVVDKEPETQKTFEEVKNEVFAALRSSKEREVQQKLFSDLKKRYDVVVHYSALSEKTTEEKETSH